MAVARKARDYPETRIHRRAVSYLRRYFYTAHGMDDPALMPFFHCPNESDVPPRYRAKLVSMGLAPGMSDLVIAWPTPANPAVPGAALELKSPTGTLPDNQKRWLGWWSRCGFAAACTKGHLATADQLLAWGYILRPDYDEWINWARTRDPRAL